jgi:rhodanese-related sulfurtransferase
MARTLKNVDAHGAAKLKDKGALMVDVRESGEYARSRIPGTQNIALSRLEITNLPLAPDQAVVFFCASGNRTNVNAARLA